MEKKKNQRTHSGVILVTKQRCIFEGQKPFFWFVKLRLHKRGSENIAMRFESVCRSVHVFGDVAPEKSEALST